MTVSSTKAVCCLPSLQHPLYLLAGGSMINWGWICQKLTFQLLHWQSWDLIWSRDFRGNILRIFLERFPSLRDTGWNFTLLLLLDFWTQKGAEAPPQTPLSCWTTPPDQLLLDFFRCRGRKPLLLKLHLVCFQDSIPCSQKYLPRALSYLPLLLWPSCFSALVLG